MYESERVVTLDSGLEANDQRITLLQHLCFYLRQSGLLRLLKYSDAEVTAA